MEPRIEYAHAADGVSIAFWTLGDGPPFVSMPNVPWSHIEQEWRVPELHQWFQRIAEKRTVVRYDSRGSGLSDRDVDDYSLDAHVLDLEAVVNHLGLESFDLFGPLHSGPAAIAYTARHPDRVSRLILWCTYAHGADEYGSPSMLKATRAMMDVDWEVYTETVAHLTFGWSTGEKGRDFAAFIREAVSREVVKAVRDAIDQYDVVNLLPLVRAPTLVLHRREFSVRGVDVARRLASRIAHARLVILEGDSPAPFMGDTESALRAVADFLGVELGPEPQPVDAYRGEPPVTILFTDMEGSTVLIQRLGDAKAQDVLHTHNSIVREALKAHGGSEVDTTGDGFMASFSSATKALECAIAMQRAFAEHNESAEEPIKVRVGMNAGEPIAEDDDLFGTAVNLAARICTQAEAGQILAPIVVKELAAGKQFMFADLGETELRGFEDPVRLYEVRWREE